MRFFLDQNVDSDVARMLRALGHECWSAHEACLSRDDDDTLTVYAHEKGAVLLTHDQEFSKRRRRRAIGHHLWLRCSELEAAVVLKVHLEDIERQVRAFPDSFICVTGSGMEVSHSWE